MEEINDEDTSVTVTAARALERGGVFNDQRQHAGDLPALYSSNYFLLSNLRQ